MGQLAREIDRLASRLGALGQVRVAGEPAQSVRDLAQRLADARAELTGEPRRAVPRLADHAVGDQITVIGRELVDAVATAGSPSAWLDALLRDVVSVRRSLP